MLTRAHWIGLSGLTCLALACGPAHADRIAVKRKRPAPLVATPQASPYTIDLIDESGRKLDVYRRGSRFYILGRAGTRYSIRVINPTALRVEALVSVDGLDVIDGKDADFKHKRGYVVPARGTLKVDGFRVSNSQVAAFRFSSVRNSYAGRKGKARNVGVVGVAIFAERARPQIILDHTVRRPPPARDRRWYGGRGDNKLDDNDDAPAQPAAPTIKSKAPAKPGPRLGGNGGSRGETAGAPAPRDYRRTSRRRPRPDRCCTKKQERPGLGTQFGERRHSAVSFTSFVRAHPTVPTAIAELRYNDAQGLIALGIRLNIAPGPGPGEIHVRETANPFPRSGFASPPAGWR